MASPKKSTSWQDMRRALSSKTKTELLNLIRDLYALNPENQDVVRAEALALTTASANWGYRIASQYAERYNSSYGTGLLPESAPMVEDIADFWCQYHLGKPLSEWLAQS